MVGTSAISAVLLTVIRTLTVLILLHFILGKWLILSVSVPLYTSLFLSASLSPDEISFIKINLAYAVTSRQSIVTLVSLED